MKIAVTGSTGQLGSAVLKELKKYELDTLSLDRGSLNFLDSGNINESLLGFNPDVIVNCAAFTQVDESENRLEEVFTVNATAPKALAEYCHQKGIRFIHLSTDSIFSSSTPIFFKPSDEPCPVNSYAMSKLQGEVGVLKAHSVGSTIIRTSWLFGDGSNKFVQAVIKRGEAGEPFKVVDDQFGQPTLTNSLAKFITFLITSETSNGIYHFASSDYVSRYEFAKNILEMAKFDPGLITPCETVASLGVAKRPKYSLLEVSESTTNRYRGISMWKQELERYFRAMTGNQ